MKTKPVRIGLIGSQFITSIHAEALKGVRDAEILAVMSPTQGHARLLRSPVRLPRVAVDARQHAVVPRGRASLRTRDDVVDRQIL